MTTNLTDLRIQQLLESAEDYDLTAFAESDDLATALRELQERRKAAEPVGEDELDQLIRGLQRYGLYPRQLAAMQELREWRKTAGVPQNGRSSAKVQVQSVDHVYGESPASIKAALVVDSSPKNAESPSGIIETKAVK